jgi:alkyldihydroxyacetonephosphate synthase
VTTALVRLLNDAVGLTYTRQDGSTFYVRPGAPPEVAKLLAIAREHRIPVMPIGRGSFAAAHDRQVRASSEGRNEQRIVVDMRRMTNILHLDSLSLTVHVQAGIDVGGLEEALGEHGMTLGDFPVETYRSTVGGVLAARGPGRATSSEGPIESACIGLSIVLADGRTVHIKAAPKRATGPDLMRLFLGSEGTLGIITAAVLRVSRRPQARILESYVLPTMDAAVEVAREALRRGARIAAVRIHDLAEATARGLAELAQLATGEQLLLVSFAGAQELIETERHLVESSVGDQGGHSIGPAAAEQWWRERIDRIVRVRQSELQLRNTRESDRSAVSAPPLEEADTRFLVTAPLGKVAPIYRGVTGSLLAMGIAARANVTDFYQDGARLAFRFTRSPDADSAAREAAVAAGGRPTAELETDPVLGDAFRALKRDLDPDNILAAGRLV